MKPFNGFPEKFEFAALPKPFLAQVLPGIDDMDELKATLGFFRVLYQKKGFPVYVTATEISGPGTGFKVQAAEQDPATRNHYRSVNTLVAFVAQEGQRPVEAGT